MSATEKNFNELKCVWMSSGVVEYKLCDCNFDCDNCPFDKAMKSIGSFRVKNPAGLCGPVWLRRIQESLNEAVQENCIVLAGNMMVRNLFNSIYYLGLTPFGWQIAHSCSTFELIVSKGQLKKGADFIKASGNWGTFCITAPCNLTIVSVFERNGEAPLSNSWLCLVELESYELENVRISNNEYLAGINAITSELFETSYLSSVGPTLNDGGFLHNRLSDAIGAKKFLNILTRVFTPE